MCLISTSPCRHTDQARQNKVKCNMSVWLAHHRLPYHDQIMPFSWGVPVALKQEKV
jgi:hypothetical protein